MSKVTALPFMEVEEEPASHDDWFRLHCTLCEYRTPSGSFYNCEMNAAGHLDVEHPEQRRQADEAMRRLPE